MSRIAQRALPKSQKVTGTFSFARSGMPDEDIVHGGRYEISGDFFYDVSELQAQAFTKFSTPIHKWKIKIGEVEREVLGEEVRDIMERVLTRVQQEHRAEDFQAEVIAEVRKRWFTEGWHDH